VSQPVAASSQQITVGPAPIAPTLSEFGLTEEDVERLLRLWLYEFSIVYPKLSYFRTHLVFCIGSYVIFFYPNLHLAREHVAGILVIALLSLIASPLFEFFLHFVEARIHCALNGNFANYRRYKTALYAYYKSKGAYDARVAKRRVEYWRSLSGKAFERELGQSYSRMGYRVTFTPTMADGGVDLVLRKDGRKTVVQCKTHAKRISISVARELVASMKDFGADAGIIACLEGVTQPVKEYVKGKQVEVLTVYEIVALQATYG
jgi:hypothetical protein